MEKTISYAGRSLPLLGSWQVIVLGSGAAGSSAAIASARAGCKTLLIDKTIRMGGTAVNALVAPMMMSWTGHRSVFFDIELQLRQQGLVTRDDLGSGMLWFTPEAMANALETLYTNAGGELLYDASFCDCILDGDRVRYLILSTSQGLVAVEASQVVDASGDAILTRAAGVPVAHGDENGNDQISSLRFEMGGIDVERYRAYCMSLGDTYSKFPTGYFYESAMVGGKQFVLEPLFQRAVSDGVLKPQDLRYFQNFSLPGKPGCMTFNCPHLVDLKDNSDAMARSRAIVEGHAMIGRLLAFLKQYMPGFEHAYLMTQASALGIRESFRLIGKYILTEEDHSEQRRFDDAVARGDWYIDVHSASKGLCHQNIYQKGDYYEIPYRSMVCDTISNLIVAGRCISTTFLMQASVRIIPTCIDMGQAAGEACSYAERTGTALNTIHGHEIVDWEKDPFRKE